MQDQKDPDQFYTLVVFESEEKARERERDPRRQEGLQVLRAMLADRLAEVQARGDAERDVDQEDGAPLAAEQVQVEQPAGQGRR